jgi:hypothetical protein
MNKHNQVLYLIEELQKLSTLGRIVTYGPIDTLKAAMSRLVNNDVYNYFQIYFESLDAAITYFNSTNYKVNIDKYALGELFNTIKLNKDVKNPNVFFIKFFENLNLIVSEIIKSGIDELFDNKVMIQHVNSLRGLAKIDYDSEGYKYLQNVILGYYDVIANKPFNVIHLFSGLKRFRLDTTFISSNVQNLELSIINYIKSKYSVSQNTAFSIYNQPQI